MAAKGMSLFGSYHHLMYLALPSCNFSGMQHWSSTYVWLDWARAAASAISSGVMIDVQSPLSPYISTKFADCFSGYLKNPFIYRFLGA